MEFKEFKEVIEVKAECLVDVYKTIGFNFSNFLERNKTIGFNF